MIGPTIHPGKRLSVPLSFSHHFIDLQEVELAALQEYAETRGFEDSIRDFDVEFFKRKQIRSIYGVEEEAQRDFFPLPHVLKGVFRKGARRKK